MTKPLLPSVLLLGATLACSQSSGLGSRDGGAGHAAPDSGDTSGLAGTSGGDGSTPNACAEYRSAPDLYASTTGSATGNYDGPALVERSTSSELVLAFTPQTATPGALPVHLSIVGLGEAAIFPRGATVWLTKDPAADTYVGFFPPPPSSLVVRETQGGRVLFARTRNQPLPVPAAPGDDVCTAPYDDGCGHGQITRHSWIFQGDTPVTIADGETGTVSVGGVAYDVSLASWTLALQQGAPRCTDYFPLDGTTASMQAKDLASFAAKLVPGPAPACARGNAERKVAYFTFLRGSTSAAIDSPARYQGKRDEAQQLECFEFETETSTPPPGPYQPFTIEVCASQGLLAEPAPQQKLWVTMRGDSVAALRTKQNGPILVGSIRDLPFFVTSPEIIQQTLGVSVSPRQGCAYALDAGGKTTYLQDAAFATTPEVVVESDAKGIVTIDGNAYDAWVVTQGGHTVTLAPH